MSKKFNLFEKLFLPSGGFFLLFWAIVEKVGSIKTLIEIIPMSFFQSLLTVSSWLGFIGGVVYVVLSYIYLIEARKDVRTLKEQVQSLIQSNSNNFNHFKERLEKLENPKP